MKDKQNKREAELIAALSAAYEAMLTMRDLLAKRANISLTGGGLNAVIEATAETLSANHQVTMKDKQNNATVEMCDQAKKIVDFRTRLRHYQKCSDPRCKVRAEAAADMLSTLNKAINKQMR